MPSGRPRLSTPWATHLTWGTCPICETAFIRRGSRRTTCGAEACKREYRRRRNLQIRPGRRAVYLDGFRICPGCGTPYESSPGTRLCPACSAWSAELRRRGIQSAVSVTFPTCPVCGLLFCTPARKPKRFCTPDCRRAAKAATARAAYIPTPPRVVVCLDCGAEVVVQGVGAPRKLCPPCAAERQKVAKRRGLRRRIARLRGLTRGDAADCYEIAARDGWTCWLCGLQIAHVSHKYGRPPHLLGPSRDHLTPAAEHGEDSAHNMAAAHFICNAVRRERPVDLEVMCECREAVEALLVG